MPCRGIHFAVTDEQLAALLATRGNDEALLGLIMTMEEAWEEDWLAENDKAWDAIHRCLTGDTLEHGDTPGHKCILGRESIHQGDDYLICPCSPPEVRQVAAFLATIDEADMRRRYDGIDAASYDGEHGDEDFGYTWAYFQDIAALFAKAAAAGRAVIFYVDQ